MLIEYSKKFKIASDIEKQLAKYSLNVCDDLLNFWKNNSGGYLSQYYFCYDNIKYLPSIILGFSSKDLSENVVFNYINETQFWDKSYLAIIHFEECGGIYYNLNTKKYVLIDEKDKAIDLCDENIENILEKYLLKKGDKK